MGRCGGWDGGGDDGDDGSGDGILVDLVVVVAPCIGCL